MKKIVLSLIFIIFLSGCSLFNPNDFVLPDDIEFINTVNELNTPEKICNYMKKNFIYEPYVIYLTDPYVIYSPDPYTLWKIKKGLCIDFAAFGVFVADYHGYETYQIKIYFKNSFSKHFIAIYKENGKYNYSSNMNYYLINASTFKEVVENYFSYPIIVNGILYKYELDYYEIFN
jgi:hypothetical protein